MGLLSKESGPSGPLGFAGLREEGKASIVSLFPWGGFAPLPLSDLLSRLSYANPADVLSPPFILSEMPVCFPPLTPSTAVQEGVDSGRRDIAPPPPAARGAPGMKTLFSIEEKLGQVFILFPRNKVPWERYDSSLVAIAFGWGSKAFPAPSSEQGPRGGSREC